MPAVPKPLRKARAARLRAAGERAAGRFLSNQVGRRLEVLIEERLPDGTGRGRSEQFAPVRLADPHAARIGEILSLTASAVVDGSLSAAGPVAT